jgi:hypothetical protein
VPGLLTVIELVVWPLLHNKVVPGLGENVAVRVTEVVVQVSV